MATIRQKKIRRFYYTGSIAILFIAAVLLSIPAYVSVKNEYENKLHQLEHSIIEQKKIFLKTVITEKISDINRSRATLKEFEPDISEKEFDILFRETIRNLIHKTKLPDNGYIWINEIIDFNGGDAYAIRFVHPNLPETEGEYLSTNTTDIEGNQPYLTELEGIKENGYVFFDYYFKKMGSDIISHKLSYAQLYEPYNWVVATGVYLDDVDMLIQKEVELMRKATNRTLMQIFLTITVSFGVLIILVTIFEKQIQALIAEYTLSLEERNNILQNEKVKLQAAYEEIEKFAYTDFLTGLLNRRAMLEKMNLEVSRMKREQNKFALLMCDVDFFKNVNDSLGHEAGDYVLTEIAHVLRNTMRREDSICRWGGEEFLCMVIHVNEEEAVSAAEKLRLAVDNHEFVYEGTRLSQSVTIGLSIFDPEIPINTLIDIADEKLYQGKKQGRNKVVM